MSDVNNESGEPRKISLAEAMKQKLAQKQQAAKSQGSFSGPQSAGSVMKSQNKKKPNNQRRRTGGS